MIDRQKQQKAQARIIAIKRIGWALILFAGFGLIFHTILSRISDRVCQTASVSYAQELGCFDEPAR